MPTAAAAVVSRDGVLAATGDTDRPFRLASVTKLLAALASLVAIEEETIALPEPAGPPGATVEHLLAHASGLGFDTGVLMPPGRKRIYSNTGYEALGDHLAAAAGMPFADYLAAAVLDPLGMAATDLRDGSPAHGGWSTVADLARFAGELLAPTLIAPTTLADATRVHFPGLDGVLPGVGPQRPLDWGLGFELRDHKSPHWTGAANSPATYGHFGGAGTFLWVDPDVAVACIALTDREFGPWALDAWPALSDEVVAWTRAANVAGR
ncbi:MAG: beta-lactamase [Acidimicrobiales bacterium]|nr:beta-lactamase [Acidimicrobiales bacterium]